MTDPTTGLTASGIASDRVRTETFEFRLFHYPGIAAARAPIAAPAGRPLPLRRADIVCPLRP